MHGEKALTRSFQKNNQVAKLLMFLKTKKR